MDKLKLRIGIMASSTFHMGLVGIVGAIPLAMAHYNTSPTVMQTVFALPAFAAVPMSLIIGSLAGKTGNKIPLQAGVLAMLIGGMTIVLLDLPLAGLILAMALIGLGLGCLMPLTAGTIADYFKGAEQSKIMAHMSAFANLGGMVLAAIGGVLIAFGWRNAFWIFAYAILILIVNHFCLPKDRKTIHTTFDDKDKGKIKLNAQVFILCGMMFILGLNFGIRNANVGLLVVGHGLGDPAVANYGTTFMAAIGILAGFIYDMIAKILKKSLLPAFIGLFAIGMALIGNATTLWMFYLGHVVSGMGLSIIVPTVISKAAQAVDSYSSTFVISMIFATMYIANFTAPAIVNTLARVVASETAQVCFNIGAVFLIVLCAFSCLYVFRKPLKTISST